MNRFLKTKLASIALLLVIAGSAITIASTLDNVTGYAWSSNIGWISLNNCSDINNPSSCQGPDYGVNIMQVAPGTITGYAWSSNIGWISFNSSVGCPGSCTPGARVLWESALPNGTYPISGWARACSVYASGCSGALSDDALLGGWDGYISLGNQGSPAYGWTVDKETGAISGFAWGSEVIGWINILGKGTFDPDDFTVSLTATPDTIFEGESSTLEAIATKLDGANVCTVEGTPWGPVTMQQAGNGQWKTTEVVTPPVTTLYKITCSYNSVKKTAQATVYIKKKPICLNHPDYTAIPDGWEKDAEGNCFPPDTCPAGYKKINGKCLTCPAGQTLTADGKCVGGSKCTASNPCQGCVQGGSCPALGVGEYACTNLPALNSVPSGWKKISNGSCVPNGCDDNGNCPAVVDFCPNIEGVQTSVPVGRTLDASGNCRAKPTYIDF